MACLPTSRLILASGSPRRRQLLTEAGIAFEAVQPSIAEPDEHLRDLAPAAQAEALAYFKARAVADKHPGALVLGADTLVAAGRTVIGKPADADDARRMLRSLSGTRHAVITGVALIHLDGQRTIASELTWVTMRPMSDEDIEDYIASGEWVDKAGAYAIQETAERFVESLEGSFSNVVGLPMELLRRMLAQARGRSAAQEANR